MTRQMGTVDRSYLLRERLGEGAMGTVYRATQLVNGQDVALKLVPQQMTTGDELSEEIELQYRLALAREFQTLASLHHPNVIRVLNYGFDQQFGPYYIMELLQAPCTPLEASIGKTDQERIQLIAQLLRALAYIHQRGVIHRDIKPSNVLVVDAELKLLDFGISVEKFEKAEFAGTAEYMAPELLRGGQPSVSSDLYAVGLLFHHMLTGTLPTDTPSMGRVLESLLDDDSIPPQPSANSLDDRLLAILDDDGADDLAEPEPAPLELSPDITPPIKAIIARLLAPNPKDRYENANEVLRELSAVVSFALPVETVATRESFLRATVLIGRDQELAKLRQSVEAMRQGTGNGYLVGGESGVGKSRLIAELRTLALVHGAWVADGQSVSEGGSFYQECLPLLRSLCFRAEMTDAQAAVLKTLLPDIGQLLGRPIPDPPSIKPEEAQGRIISAVIALLQRLTKPLVLIMEDLHWARSESLALLNRVSEQISQLPVLLVGTYRSDEGPQLPSALPHLRHMPLSRLDATQIAKLSESILGTAGEQPELVAYLERQTEGNAFFLVEIVRALAENAGELTRIGQGELPENVLTTGIERIVDRRLEHLPGAFLPWLEFAATQGRTLDPPVIESAFPEIPVRSFLIECANAAILETQGSDWRFVHDKLREGVLKRIDQDQRKRLHRKVAEAIESIHIGESRSAKSATLAYHYAEAGLFVRALQYYLQAGDSAAKLCLYEDARAHYSAALTLVKQLAESTELRRLHADLLLKQVHVGLINDSSQAQLRRLTEARTLLEPIVKESVVAPADRLRMARVDYYTGRAHYYAGQPKEAIYYYQRALPVGKEFRDQELMVIPSYVIGMALFSQGYFEKARELLEHTLEPIVEHFGIGLDSIRCGMFYSSALAATGHAKAAILAIERPQQWVLDLAKPVFQGMFAITKITVFVLLADWPTVLQVSTQLLSLSKRSSEVMLQYVPLDSLAVANSHMGNHTEALEYRARAAELRRSVGGGLSSDWFEATEAEILLNAGHVEAALQQAQKTATSSKAQGQLYSHAIAERAWGCALARLGCDSAEVDAHLASSLQISQASGQIMNVAQTELRWGLICRERGDQDLAQQHFEKAIHLLETGGYEYALQEARRVIHNV